MARAVSLFLAALVGVVTVGLAQAAQTITTPNAMHIPYSLSFASQSAPIAIPMNQPVLVMGGDTDFARNFDVGVGQATRIRVTSDGLLVGTALDVNRGFPATIFLNSADHTAIVVFNLDLSGYVPLMTDATNIFVGNNDDNSSGSGIPVGHTGVITMIW